MRCWSGLAVLLALCAVCAYSYPAGCYFSLTSDANGRDWLVDPNGKPFLSLGVDNINEIPDITRAGTTPYHDVVVAGKYYNDVNWWAASAVGNLTSWNFNTAGAWSSEFVNSRMPAYVVNLELGLYSGIGIDRFPYITDLFDPAWEATVRSKAAELTAPHKNNQNLLGYMLDNELHWAADFRSTQPLIATYMGFPKSSAGYQRAVKYLTDNFGSIAALTDRCKTLGGGDGLLKRSGGGWGPIMSFDELALWEWPTGYVPAIPMPTELCKEIDAGFVGLVASRYFTVLSKAIRAVDPNHLILGVRMPGQGTDHYQTSREVWKAMKGSVDVATLNWYTRQLGFAKSWGFAGLYDFHEWSGAPILIGEFSFRDMSMPVLNKEPTGSWTDPMSVTSQAERGNMYDQYISSSITWPHIVGYHWFEFVDQPAEGRKRDLENSNFGLTDANGRAYDTLVQRMKVVNDVPNLQTMHTGFDMAGVPSKLTPKCVGKPDPCNGVNCGPYGKCLGGVCQCTAGFTGTTCQNPLPYDVVLLRTYHSRLIRCGTLNRVIAVEVEAGEPLSIDFYWQVVKNSTNRISLKCLSSGQFLSARQPTQYGYPLNAESTIPKDWEVFELQPIVSGVAKPGDYSWWSLPDNGKFDINGFVLPAALKSFWGKFLSAGPDGGLSGGADSVGEYERLGVLRWQASSPATLSSTLIRTFHNTYLKCDPATGAVSHVAVSANTPVTDDFRWDVQYTGSVVALSCAASHKFLSVQQYSNAVSVSSSVALDWEKFSVCAPEAGLVQAIATGDLNAYGIHESVVYGGFKTVLRTFWNRALSARPGGAITADAIKADTFEQFALFPPGATFRL